MQFVKRIAQGDMVLGYVKISAFLTTVSGFSFQRCQIFPASNALLANAHWTL